MAISYVGGRTFFFAGGTTSQVISLTTLTGGSDTAPQVGDFVVVFYGSGSNVTRTLSVTGYTSLGTYVASSTYVTNYTGGYKFMGATPDTSVTVSGTGSTADAGAGTIHVFRGVDTTTPLDVATVTAGSTTTTRPNPGAITPTTAGAWIIAAGAGANIGGASTTFSSSDLTSFITVSSNDVYDVTVGGGIKTDWTSGAFDPAQFTYSGTDSASLSSYALTVALRPSPNVTVRPTGVSATGQVGSTYTPTAGTIDYVGGKTLGFAGTTSTTNVSLTDLTGGFLTAPQEGDLVVVSYGVAAGGAPATGISIGSSYTNLSVLSQTDSRSISFVVGYKFMGSTPDTSVTVSQTFSVNNAGCVTVQVYRGIDPTTPLDVTPTSAGNINTFLVNPPAITPVTAGAVVAVSGGGAAVSLATNAAYSSSDLLSFSSVFGNAAQDVLLGAGYVRWVSGAVDPATFTANVGDSTQFSWASYSVALRPASAVSPDVTASVTGVSATGAVGTAVAVGDAAADATGVSGTGEVGDVTVSTGTNVDVPVTGVEATGQAGTADATGDATADATGVSATGDVGTVTVSTGTNVTADVTGVSASGEVGTATATGDATADATGVSGSGEVGTVTVVISVDVTVSVTGVEATGQVGTAVATGDAAVDATGVSSTGQVGTVTAFADVTADATGVSATGEAGTAYAITDATGDVTGVEAAGQAGGVSVVGSAATDVTGVSAAGDVGSVVVIPSTEVPVVGVSAVGSSGSATVVVSQTVSVLGLFATGQVSAVLVWGQISPSQVPDYAAVVPAQSPGYNGVDPAQTPNWMNIPQ